MSKTNQEESKIGAIEAQDEAIAIIRQEKMRWEDTTSWVTDRVAFRIRPLIRMLRKNYWGVFDYPIDQVTGRQKTWVPLTQATVENVVKSIDMDTKDITFRAKNPDGYAITEIVRAAVRDYLDKDRFGEKIDELARDIATDGTAVWKTIKYKEKGKDQVKTVNVNLLNIYTDPTEQDIQHAYRFTERSIMVPSEISNMDGWDNTTDLSGSQSLARIDSQYKQLTPGTTAEYRDVWEMWGKIPKWFITLNKKDKDSNEEIDGHIVISGIEVGGPTCHLIEENEGGLKPYEECRYSKVSNRWYGVGISERLMWLQVWLNTIINTRINRSLVSQLGLFKIKKGSGITPAMIARLSANGAVLVSDMEDINPLQMPPNDNTTYTDETRIMDWSQKVTSTYDVSVGAPTAASSTATANALQNTNAKTAFTLVREEIGMFIERWMNRHVLPVIAKQIGEGDIIRFSAEEDSYKDIVQRVVAYEGMKKLEEMYAKGFVPTQTVLMQAIQSAEEKMMKGKDIFVKNLEEIISDNVDAKIHVTDEDMDTSVIVNNLMQALQIAPEYKEQIIKEAFDLMGLPQPKTPITPPMQPGAPMGQPGQSTQMGMPSAPAQQNAEAIQTNSGIANQQALAPKM